MSTTYIRPGTTIQKDPNAQRVYSFDWNENLPAGAQLSASAWIVSVADGKASDAALTTASASFNASARTTSIAVSGGTVGRRYRLTNRITTNETPPQVDDRSIFIDIVER